MEKLYNKLSGKTTKEIFDEAPSESSNSNDTQYGDGAQSGKDNSIQNPPPNENNKESITQNNSENKNNSNLQDLSDQRKNETFNEWAKDKKAQAVAEYKSNVDKLTQPFISKDLQAEKDDLYKSYQKQRDSLSSQYLNELKTVGPGENKAVDEKYSEKMKNLNERFTSLNNGLETKVNKGLPSHVLELMMTYLI